MWKKSWLGLGLLLLEGCRKTPPPPPLSEDTTLQILDRLYTLRAQLQLQHVPLPQAETLLARLSYETLRTYRIDSLRWDSTRRYYATHPEKWEKLVEKLLSPE